MNSFFDKFRLSTDNEEFATVVTNIDSGVVFRGTNLWILIFAIFVASLGLNLNSTAVIIGAMLISPLMGPIMGIGLGMGINDLSLLKKALNNYFSATAVALTTSTVFFFISPLNEAHSEILARTSPTIYDVLIAFFGGVAGIVATSSKQKGNVIPGVAIATALMPPLCTAGYGLATFQFKFFFGAFYLFIINTVFIALATFIFTRLQHFPFKQLQDEKAEKMARRIVWTVVLITLLPSVYFGYDMVQQNKFTSVADKFINNETRFPNDYLLSKKIDAKSRVITLVFGGNEILPIQIESLKKQLKNYDLANASLIVKQGFAYLDDNKGDQKDIHQSDQSNQLKQALLAEENQFKILKAKLDSISDERKTGQQVYTELKVRYPALKAAIIQPSLILSDSSAISQTYLVLLSFSKNLPSSEKRSLENWLKVRLRADRVKFVFDKN